MISQGTLDKLEFPKILQYISKYSATDSGKNYIHSLQPLDDLPRIREEGTLVTQAKEILIRNNSFPLDYLPDMNEIISKSAIQGAVLDTKSVLEVLKLAVNSRNVFQFLKSNSETGPFLFSKTANDLFVDKLFEHHIQKIVGETGEIKENASPKLQEIRKEINSKRDDLIRSVNRIVKSLSEQDIAREEYLTLRDGRIVIPVKAEHKRHIKGFIHSESATGQTVYIEPEETLDLNNEIVSLSFAERREIERLLRELTKMIGSESSRLKKSISVIAYLDSIFSRAKYSLEVIGVFPEINNVKPLFIQDARHPILLKKLGKNNAVPLNLEIKKEKVILITGPNAGGKTVVLKTIGLLISLFQSGIHIPVSPDSNMHLVTGILLDIGDEQSLEDDLSTFSSHLSNINSILKNAGPESLILLDEIGTGTDPAEGSALAAAVLIRLRDKGAIVIATTHHGSLKLIANELQGFANAAMEFDTENLKPTYVFKQGIPGSSYAFEVAKRIGLEEDLLKLANQYLDSDVHKVEDFLVELETKSRQVEAKLKQVEIENTRLAGLSNVYKQNLDKLNKEKKEILKRTKSEADEYLRGINKKFEQVIKDLKESNADKDTIKASQKVISELKEENRKFINEKIGKADEDEAEKIPIAVGDYVSIKNTAASGEVIELNEEKNSAVLKVGAMKMKVSLNELFKVKKEKKEVKRFSNYEIAGPKMRLDIRGERADEAEYKVVKFLDEAYSGGLERIEILHGKGTGALKKMVIDILKKYDKVKNFYFAPIEFGGDGITIVEMK
ncbi:MAG: endonuclease MutS2 [Ignavibacteria bacterium]